MLWNKQTEHICRLRRSNQFAKRNSCLYIILVQKKVKLQKEN